MSADVQVGEPQPHAHVDTKPQASRRSAGNEAYVLVAVPAGPDAGPDARAMVEALRLLEQRGKGRCEHSTERPGACFAGGRTADAVYACDLACTTCVAFYALTGQPLVLGAGREAERVAAAEALLEPLVAACFTTGDDGLAVSFDGTPSMGSLTREDVDALRAAGWTGPTARRFLESRTMLASASNRKQYDAIDTAIKYVRYRNEQRPGVDSYGVQVDAPQAEAWLALHRPDWSPTPDAA